MTPGNEDTAAATATVTATTTAPASNASLTAVAAARWCAGFAQAQRRPFGRWRNAVSFPSFLSLGSFRRRPALPQAVSGAGRGRGLAAAFGALALGRGVAGGLAVCALAFLASCNAGRPLTPAWQQDSNLYYQGTAARQAQTSTTPHGVARVIYAQPDHLRRLLEKQGDVADAQHGLARMGDGTLDLGVQDAVTGKWLESYLCGGHLFVAALPHQAYRLVLKNRTPMPLEFSVGVDGRDLETGSAASLHRGSLHVPARGTLTVDHGAHGPLLFRAVQDDMVLYDLGPKGRPGILQVAAYLATDAPSVGPQKMRPSQVLPLSLFPIEAPEQYR